LKENAPGYSLQRFTLTSSSPPSTHGTQISPAHSNLYTAKSLYEFVHIRLTSLLCSHSVPFFFFSFYLLSYVHLLHSLPPILRPSRAQAKRGILLRPCRIQRTPPELPATLRALSELTLRT